MLSEQDVIALKERAVRSCIACHGDTANSLGRMFAHSPYQGGLVRKGLYDCIRRLVDAVFANDDDAVPSLKAALFDEIRQAQPLRLQDRKPGYYTDDQINDLVATIKRNITRFTRHLAKANAATSADVIGMSSPGTIIDTASTPASEQGSRLYGPGYQNVPSVASLWRIKK